MCERCGCDALGTPRKEAGSPPPGRHQHWHVHADGTAHSHFHGHEHGREHVHPHAPERPSVGQPAADATAGGGGEPIHR